MNVSKLFVSTVISLFLIGCGPAEKKTTAPVLPEVEVVNIKLQKHEVSNRWPGKTKTLAKAELSSQVRGVVTNNNFKEGAVVKKGDVLIEIDSAPILAEISSNKSDVERAKIELELATTTFKASEKLVKEKVISELDAEKIKVEQELAKVEVLTAEAKLLKSELRLKQSKIIAPFDGVIGLNDINVGELIGPLKGNIIEVISNDKIEVYVQIGQNEHFENMMMLKDKTPEEVRTIHIELPNGDIYEHQGVLDYIGTEAKESSGYISYRVIFPNPDGLLVAGQNVYLLGRDIEKIEVIKIPQSAIQQDQKGQYVYTVNAENIINKAYVELGSQDSTDIIVTSGLKVGDKLVSKGFLQAKENHPVKIAK